MGDISNYVRGAVVAGSLAAVASGCIVIEKQVPVPAAQTQEAVRSDARTGSTGQTAGRNDTITIIRETHHYNAPQQTTSGESYQPPEPQGYPTSYPEAYPRIRYPGLDAQFDPYSIWYPDQVFLFGGVPWYPDRCDPRTGMFFFYRNGPGGSRVNFSLSFGNFYNDYYPSGSWRHHKHIQSQIRQDLRTYPLYPSPRATTRPSRGERWMHNVYRNGYR